MPSDRERGNVGQTLYLTTLPCRGCETETTYAHRGPTVAVDQEPPLPDVERCPKCGWGYRPDLGAAVTEVRDVE